MQPNAPYQDVIRELRCLTAEYIKMKTWAHEAEARGYEAVFASAAVADQAIRLCIRSVRALERAALLLPFDEARETRQQLLRVARALASLVSSTSPEDPGRQTPASHLQAQHLSLRDLLHELDSTPHGKEGGSLHQHLLAAAAAAAANLSRWKPGCESR